LFGDPLAAQRVRADVLGMQPWQPNEIAGLLFAVRQRAARPCGLRR
jgi:hypothetical protein